MTNLQVFDGNLGQVRTITKGEDIWFVAKDIAEILDYSNTAKAVQMHTDDEERADFPIWDGSQMRNQKIINESGLYSLILSSKKPQAKAFKKWITSEVIPTIRKTGGYVSEDREEEFIHNYFPSFSEEVKKAMVLDLREQNKQLQATIEVQAPKVEKYEDFLDKDGSLTATQVVDKLRELGEKPVFIRSAVSLNKFLNAKGVQYKRGNSWYVYQKYEYLAEEGYIVNRQVPTYEGYGNQMRWTPKGVDFIIELIKNDKANKY